MPPSTNMTTLPTATPRSVSCATACAPAAVAVGGAAGTAAPDVAAGVLGADALGAPLISLVSMTPVTINGLFLAEGAFVLVYASAGVPAEVALAAAIVATCDNGLQGAPQPAQEGATK